MVVNQVDSHRTDISLHQHAAMAVVQRTRSKTGLEDLRELEIAMVEVLLGDNKLIWVQVGHPSPVTIVSVGGQRPLFDEPDFSKLPGSQNRLRPSRRRAQIV